MPVKRLAHIRTAQSLINHGTPANRTQLASKLARLEHEKARLERERQLWRTKQRQAEERLLLIEQQLEEIQSKLLPSTPTRPNDAAVETPGWRKMSLEY